MSSYRTRIDTCGKAHRLPAPDREATEFEIGNRVRNPDINIAGYLEAPSGWWFIKGIAAPANEAVRAGSRAEAYVRAAARVYGVALPWLDVPPFRLPGNGFTLWL